MSNYSIPEHIQCIIFDLDNTLIDIQNAEHSAAIKFYNENTQLFSFIDEESFANRWHEVFLVHYHEYETGVISTLEQRRRRIREMIGGNKMSDESVDNLYNLYHNYYVKEWTLYPDTIHCLEKLKNLKLAIISNGEKEQQMLKMNKLGIKEYFSISIFPSDVRIFKPNPRIFLEVCKNLELKPENCLSIGDNLQNEIIPCLSLNMSALLLDRDGKYTEIEYRKISSLTQLLI